MTRQIVTWEGVTSSRSVIDGVEHVKVIALYNGPYSGACNQSIIRFVLWHSTTVIMAHDL